MNAMRRGTVVELSKSLGFDRFEDVTMTLEGRKRVRVPVVFQLQANRMPPCSSCQVTPVGSRWLRKTMAWGGTGSIRYQYHRTAEEALRAGATWAKRKLAEWRREVKRKDEEMTEWLRGGR